MEARYQLRQSPLWNPEILAQARQRPEISTRPAESVEVGRHHGVVRLDPPVGPGPVPVQADPGAVGQATHQRASARTAGRRTGKRRPGRPARGSPRPPSTRRAPPRRSRPAPRPPARRPPAGSPPSASGVRPRPARAARPGRGSVHGSPSPADLPTSRRGSPAVACRSGSAGRPARPAAVAVSYARDRSLEYSATGSNAGQHPGRLRGLVPAHRVQADVGLALEAASRVPLRTPVPPQDQPIRGHRRSSTPSAISGQSRQSRSSA